MDNKFKIPEMSDFQQIKIFADATSAFAEHLVILNKSIESMAKDQNKVLEGMAKDQKDMKEYFMNANGFQKDLKNMQEDVIEVVLEKMKSENDIIKEKIETSSRDITKSIINKIIGLLLGSLSIGGTIIYVIQNVMLRGSINTIVQEVLKQIPK